MPRQKAVSRVDKILITGATGFVGANLARKLVENGHEVHVLTRRTSNKWRLADISAQINDHCLDLLEAEKLARLLKKIKPDVIFHLATAGIYGGKHLSDRALIETNLIGTVNLLTACDGINYKCLVNTGSSSEYGPKDKRMKESDVCEPVTTYGATKLAATLYARALAIAKEKPIITFRLFSPFGPFDDPSRLMTYAIINALTNQELKLANPQAVRDYIYIDDVIDLYVKSIDKADTCKGEVFNVGSGSETTIAKVVENIIQITGSSSKVSWHSVIPRSFDAKKWEADINKTARFFDWRPKYSVDAGLRSSITWFQGNLSRYDKAGHH